MGVLVPYFMLLDRSGAVRNGPRRAIAHDHRGRDRHLRGAGESTPRRGVPQWREPTGAKDQLTSRGIRMR